MLGEEGLREMFGGGWYGLVLAWTDSTSTGARASPTVGAAAARQ
jgi:hypothetical protein